MWKNVNTPPEEQEKDYLVTDGTTCAVAFYGMGTWTVTALYWMDRDIKFWDYLPELPTK